MDLIEPTTGWHNQRSATNPMNRPVRVAFEILAPPLLGAAPFYFAAGTGLIADVFYGKPAFAGENLLWIVGPYLVAGIPTIAYTVVMELAFARSIKPSDWRAVVLSSTLGMLAGILIGLLLGSVGRESHRAGFAPLITMIPLGVIVGFLVGITVKIFSGHGPNHSPEPTPGAVH